MKVKYVLVNIPKANYAKVIFEDDFMDKNEFRTQNMIYAVLRLLGLNKDEFDVSIHYYDSEKGE